MTRTLSFICILAIGLLDPTGRTPVGDDPRLLASQAVSQAAGRDDNDLDALMAVALKHRDESWRKLHDYVLREKEALALDGPGRVRLYGAEREFNWYMREGYLVRSPERFDKVKVGEADRLKYETEWLRKEKERETTHAQKQAEAASRHRSAEAPPEIDVESFMREGGEPRFISEAYFMQFPFEPGNYYLAGRETMEGREVVKVEYYPTRLYEDKDERERERREPRPPRQKPTPTEVREDEFERQFNKVALVTLWVDPSLRQIVKYTFDNVDFGFLPGRWIVRVGDVRISMTMGQPFPDVWFPRELTLDASATLAVGTYAASYVRSYYEYKQAETGARIRHYGPSRER